MYIILIIPFICLLSFCCLANIKKKQKQMNCDYVVWSDFYMSK